MDQQNDQDNITAYHGSPHDFEQFDLSKIGTGEGAQAYGHGLYFAEAEPTAKTYRDALSGDPVTQTGEKPDWQNKGSKSLALMALAQSMDKKLSGDDALKDAMQELHKNAGLSERNDIRQRYYDAVNSLGQMLGKEWNIHPGHMYEVRINAHPDHFINWDEPINEQPYAYTAINKLASHENKNVRDFFNYVVGDGDLIGKELYDAMTNKKALGLSPERASAFLSGLGIKGIKYLDSNSRGMPYAVHIMYKGKPYTDPIPMADYEQAERHADEYRKIGFDVDVRKHGSHNYVVFDDKLVSTKRKYADGGSVAA